MNFNVQHLLHQLNKQLRRNNWNQEQSLSVRDVQPSTTKHNVMYSTIDQPSYKKPVTLPMSQQSNRQVEPVYSCYAKTSVTIDGAWDSP